MDFGINFYAVLNMSPLFFKSFALPWIIRFARELMLMKLIIFCLWNDAQSKYYFLLAKFLWECLSDSLWCLDCLWWCVCVCFGTYCKVDWRNSEYLLKSCVQIQALEFKQKNKNLLAEYLEERIIYICLFVWNVYWSSIWHVEQIWFF